MSTQGNQENQQKGVGEVSGQTPKWRRRLAWLGVYGTLAGLAGTSMASAAAPPAPSRAARAQAVSIICSNGTGSVAKTQDPGEPGKPVKYRASATCSVTGPTESGAANGTASFSIDRNNCANATTNVTGRVTWPSGKTSDFAITLVWTATAGQGISASITTGSITGGAYAGAVVAGTAAAPEQVRVDCETNGTFDGATGSGNGKVTGS
ncbi:xanthine dehydrogenase molybdenum-binding subunit [Streptomyces sp. NBRC 110611]|nr:xanthine dehydrogenase molybdenum-binding subunit [Streptomyces sp. NBRC 110611]